MRCTPAHVVRLIEPRDLVGIYSIDSIAQLVIIDECKDLSACEYTRLRFPGGVMREGPAVPVPVERPEGADASEPDPVPTLTGHKLVSKLSFHARFILAGETTRPQRSDD